MERESARGDAPGETGAVTTLGIQSCQLTVTELTEPHSAACQTERTGSFAPAYQHPSHKPPA